MRALVAAPGADGGIELRDLPEPDPQPDQAVVEVRAVSLNRGECSALAAAEDGWRPGWDLAGEVSQAAADGSGPGPGTRVVGWMNGGSWAERAAVRTHHLAAIPDELGFDVASTLPVAGLTALGTLGLAGSLFGARVLVTGGAGGVGRFAIQLAHRAGAYVTAVVGRPERGAGLADLGADAVVVGLDAEGPAFDLILESVGGASFAAAVARLAREGLLVSFGNSSNEPTTFDPRTLYRKGAPRIEGFFVTWLLLNGRLGSRELGYLAGLAASGELRSDIALRTDWTEAASAIDALMERRVDGKAVLTLG
jgi:NADPH:quinone reductase-like Zn-dependent oxidoreductase